MGGVPRESGVEYERTYFAAAKVDGENGRLKLLGRFCLLRCGILGVSGAGFQVAGRGGLAYFLVRHG